MRKLSFALAALAATALGSGTAAAAPKDFVTGAGNVGTFAHVEVSAHELAEGVAKGSLSFQPAGFERQRADVNCLRVDGNEAVVGGEVREGEQFREDFNVQGIAFFIRDNGPPGLGTRDELTPELSPSSEGLCDLEPSFAFVPLTSGNLLVRDATP